MYKSVAVEGDAIVSPRLIGSYTRNREGNLIFIFGGIHGNERSGVIALREVFRHLEDQQPSFRGKVVGITGNLAALAAGKRFVDKDLNRNWEGQHIERLRNTPPALFENSEDRDVFQIVELITEEIASGDFTRVVFLDLHTTWASGGGFSLIKDSEQNRKLAARLHLPLVFNIEKKLHATLQHYFYERGISGLVFEGGQIGSKDAVEVHTAGVWMMLSGLGCLHPKDVPDYRMHINRILDAAEGLPKATKAIYRHHIVPEDRFRMLQGFVNFQAVQRGQQLGEDRYGPVTSPFDGLLLMPLYQEQGEDGFFLVESVEF